MKVDLHFHTYATNKDTSERNFDLKVLSDLVIENNIGLLAVTNHDSFSQEKFDEFVSYLDTARTKVFRGVEIDVEFNDDRIKEIDEKEKHTILIFDDEFSEDEISEIIKRFLNSDFYNLIDIVDSEFKDRILIYPHGKSHKSFTPNEITYVNEYISKKDIVIVWEIPYKENDLYKDALERIPHLPATDITSIDQYAFKANRLYDLITRPNDLKQMISLIKENKLFKKVNIPSFDIPPAKIKVIEGERKGEVIGEIDITNGLNVIFGKRGTGKSEILNQIKTHCSNYSLEAKHIKSGDSSSYEDVIKKIRLEQRQKIDEKIDENVLDQPSENYTIEKIKFNNYIKEWVANKNNKKLVESLDKYKITSSQSISYSKNNSILEIDKILESIASINNSINNLIKAESDIEIDVTELDNFRESMISLKRGIYISDASRKIAKELLEKFKSEFGVYKAEIRSVNSTIGIYEYWNKIWKRNLEISIKNHRNFDLIKNESADVVFETLPENEELKFSTKITLPTDVANKELFDQFQKGDGLIGVNFMKAKNYCKLHNEMKKPFNVISDIRIKFKNLIIDEEDNFEEIPFLSDMRVYDGNVYNGSEIKTPSKGQAHLIMLEYELFNNIDQNKVILIDEIERGLENSYIINYLNPEIRRIITKLDKSVYITTHNANVAVLHETSAYYMTSGLTDHEIFYTKNEDEMVSINKNSTASNRDWKTEVVNTLEGGKGALIERTNKYKLKEIKHEN